MISYVCMSVRMRVRARKAKLLKLSFGMAGLLAPKDDVLDGDPDSPALRQKR